MAEYLIQDTSLEAIADAINAKTGGSSAMTPAEMVTAIGSISGGGGSDLYKSWKTSGEVEFTDQRVTTITLPINCPCTNAMIVMYAIKSGTVADGVVTEDSGLMAHSTKSVMFTWTAVTPLRVNPNQITVGGDGYSSTFTRAFTSGLSSQIYYASRSAGLNGGNLGTSTSLSNGSLILTSPYPSTYVFCDEGSYMKFHYDVVAWND